MPSLWLISLVALVLTFPGLSSAAPPVETQHNVGVREGEKGYIHLVVRGDTLWHISDAYLGTPWIWPSVWGENEEIQNPHLIYPKDEVWISERLMRKLTPEEAERLRAALADGSVDREALEAALLDDQDGSDAAWDDQDGSDAARDGTDGADSTDGAEYASEQFSHPLLQLPAAPTEEDEEVPSRDDPFAALDQGETGTRRVLRFSGLHRYGLISDIQYTGTGAVMGSHEPHYWSSQGQRVIVSLGEGKTHMGDALTIFRTIRRVVHPETLEVLGYFVEILGRAEITEIHPQSSFVRITASYSEIEPGDRVMPYEEQPSEFTEVHSEDRVEGRVLAYQPYRIRSSIGDLVVLDRGLREGITPGRRFEIFRAARDARDPQTLEKVLVPDDVIGGAFVVKVSEKTSLALVTRARAEVLIGDRFRSKRY